MESSSYILDAAAAEKTYGIKEAFSIASAGYEAFPDDYELVFMLGGYSFCMGNAEMAYVYYLLAESLCDTEDKALITENKLAIDTDTLDAKTVRDILNNIISHRFSLRAYEKTYSFVSDLLFSENQFLFQKICDQWLRYCLIILEITACEKNRGLTDYTADHYNDWEAFGMVLEEFKFAFRRIWFGFPLSGQQYLKTLAARYLVSPEFIVITCKYTVHPYYLSDTLRCAARLLSDDFPPLMSGVIMQYADWFTRTHKTNYSVMPVSESYDNGMDVLFLDASETDCKTPKCDMDNGAGTDHCTVSYIMCANNEKYVSEVLLYLRRQRLPENCKMTVYVVYHAVSMASGYNLAMHLSHADCKIYIHQDTFIFDIYYTAKILSALDHTDYQMLGLAGSVRMPSSGRWWDSRQENIHLYLYQDLVIYIYDSTTDKRGPVTFETGSTSANLTDADCPDTILLGADCLDTDCLDGVLLATKQDVLWREDLFTNFHFYDISQSYEFKKRNFRIGLFINPVPGGGVLHEVSVSKDGENDMAYEASRKTFLRAYQADLSL